MADVEASVRDLVSRDCDCAAQALAQMDLRWKINLLIGEWKAAGGGDILPDIRARLHPVKKLGKPTSAAARRRADAARTFREDKSRGRPP